MIFIPNTHKNDQEKGINLIKKAKNMLYAIG